MGAVVVVVNAVVVIEEESKETGGMAKGREEEKDDIFSKRQCGHRTSSWSEMAAVLLNEPSHGESLQMGCINSNSCAANSLNSAMKHASALFCPFFLSLPYSCLSILDENA